MAREDGEGKAEGVVRAFYEALAAGDAKAVAGLLGSGGDLEWRFHGRPRDQHLMRQLTGAAQPQRVRFAPASLLCLQQRRGDHEVVVLAEGQLPPDADVGCRGCCWVHVWTVRRGRITELREYFNTSLTVLRPSPSSRAPSPPVWQSQLGVGSIPSLILALA